MSYKPLSQTVTDGQKNPISSDAVHDHVAAEIAAIPSGANDTLSNLTAPTAVNQNLNMGTNQLRFNAGNRSSSISINPLSDIATGIDAVTPSNSGASTINTSASITDVLQIGDRIYLQGLTTRAVVLTKPTSTSITVTPTLGGGGGGSSRQIIIEPLQFSSVPLSISPTQTLFNNGTETVPSITFSNAVGTGISISTPQAGWAAGFNRTRMTFHTVEPSALEAFRFRIATQAYGTSTALAIGPFISTFGGNISAVSIYPKISVTGNTITGNNGSVGADSSVVASGFHAWTLRKFSRGFFSSKLSVNAVDPPTNCLTYPGVLNLRAPVWSCGYITYTFNGTSTLVLTDLDSNSTAWRNSISVGDKLRIRKTGEPDLFATLVAKTTALSWVLDITVPSVYSGSPGTGLCASFDPLIIEDDAGASIFQVSRVGNVGIGTATPAEKLEVNGNIKGGTISFNADANRQATVTNLGFLTATKTHDFGSISHGDEEETTITVTGAAVGDAVFVGAPSAIEASLNWCAYVSAADTVTLRVQNVDSSGSIDPASATWRVTVLKT